MTTGKHGFYSILALVSLLGLGITQSARANFIATIDQVGTNVVATGSGTIDLAGLTFLFPAGLGGAGVNPSFGVFNTAGGPVALYSGVSGPTSFGSVGFFESADSSSGNPVAIQGAFGRLAVPQGYLTGNPLSATFTFNNATFASLGITPGIYTWTWGTGAHADSFTLFAGVPVPTPDTGSSLSLLLMATGLVLSAARKRRAA